MKSTGPVFRSALIGLTAILPAPTASTSPPRAAGLGSTCTPILQVPSPASGAGVRCAGHRPEHGRCDDARSGDHGQRERADSGLRGRVDQPAARPGAPVRSTPAPGDRAERQPSGRRRRRQGHRGRGGLDRPGPADPAEARPQRRGAYTPCPGHAGERRRPLDGPCSHRSAVQAPLPAARRRGRAQRVRRGSRRRLRSRWTRPPLHGARTTRLPRARGGGPGRSRRVPPGGGARRRNPPAAARLLGHDARLPVLD